MFISIIVRIYYLVLLFFFHGVVFGQFSESKLEELQSALDGVISPVTSSGITISAKVIHADYNKPLFEYKPEIKVIPASITKLITMACAFSKLGQSYNFETVVYT